MQMLENLGQNETYILYFLPPPCSKNVSAPLQPVSTVLSNKRFSGLMFFFFMDLFRWCK